MTLWRNAACCSLTPGTQKGVGKGVCVGSMDGSLRWGWGGLRVDGE